MAGDAVVVDLDGTVWDSAPWYEALAAGTGKRAPTGLTAARLLRSVGFTPRRFAKVCAAGEPPLRVYPGVGAALRGLADRGVPLGVVTNLPGWMAQPMLEATGLAEVLNVVVDYTVTARHKPRPDPLIEACRRLACQPGHAWYVGDAHSDGQAASTAGMPFAWASWGYTPDPPPSAHRVLRRPKDISKLLGGPS